MIIKENMTIQNKLEILSDAAKYDVACTSSGVDRKGMANGMGNSVACGICHTFSADGRCISLLKILLTNECIFDCKYCQNRASNDVMRATFTPDEVCTLTMEFYRRNYIEGLFLSSGVIKNPNHTMELMCQTLRMLREIYQFNGYIHCKAVPGADASVIEMTGWYADRMSVNLELPTADGLKALAPHKNRNTILKPMKQIQLGRENTRLYLPKKNSDSNFFRYSSDDTVDNTFDNRVDDTFDNRVDDTFDNRVDDRVMNSILDKYNFNSTNKNRMDHSIQLHEDTTSRFGIVKPPSVNRGFVPAGQSTQMIIGATPENDYQIISVAEALYQRFDLKRVFYSAYVSVNHDSNLPVLPDGPPLLREHRLYQADWLLRFYGFGASELLSEKRPNFNILLDPKCNWALGHLEQFPIEVNKADYYTLLRVPGIGVKSAQRIVKARKNAMLRFEDLKKIGVVLKRAIYFITCNGKMMYPVKIEENFITSQLSELKEKLPMDIAKGITYKQISLFDDVTFNSVNQIN